MNQIVPYSLRDAPALIEKLLPVQKLSAEAYKEQMAGIGKTLTALGSYWKGRKPLILAKACVLGCLLPATEDLERDLEIFEMLMGMDAVVFGEAPGGEELQGEPLHPGARAIRGARRAVPGMGAGGCRPEECGDELFDHIWEEVNAHLGTDAHSFPELVEQLGVMRFGHRPRVADTFCGSGQIPFEAARLGCDVYASDLNPVACMLTWGAFHIVGGIEESRGQFVEDAAGAGGRVQAEIDRLGVETDGQGWRGKCLSLLRGSSMPSDWLDGAAVADTGRSATTMQSSLSLCLIPIAKRYEIRVRSGVSAAELADGRGGHSCPTGKYGQEPTWSHRVDGMEYTTKISTLRGDYQNAGRHNRQPFAAVGEARLRAHARMMSSRSDFTAIQWMRPKLKRHGDEFEFRSVY